MKTYINMIWQQAALLCICLCGVCSCSDVDGPYYIDPFIVDVRFESASGTNLADSLNIIDKTKPETWDAKKEDIEVQVYRGSDHKPLDISTNRWGYINGNTVHNFPAGTILSVFATDMRIWDEDFRGSETYIFEFRSKKLFGNDEPHTIKWFVCCRGRANYNVYKCEVDNEDMPLSKSKMLMGAECTVIHAEVTTKLKSTTK